MLDHIGWYFRRHLVWHFVESEIGLDVVARCGRRMDVSGAEFSRELRNPLCQQCVKLQ